MKWHKFSISEERQQIVVKEISEGSEPEMRFYIMVAVSTMIASFGLITNSTAVIIGAMLVAPLMTPIFGIALALIRSDTVLFGRALKAEIAGVAAAIAMGLILGLLYPALEPTPEMIARTEPQLFDLLVAVFSGFAGAYALMDEKISPALPGVAIATAIVPPLAHTALCFSVGQYIAGIGSFLLFFALDYTSSPASDISRTIAKTRPEYAFSGKTCDFPLDFARMRAPAALPRANQPA